MTGPAFSMDGAPPAERRSRVLFVDDEERILTTMRVMFRRQYEVHLANSGAMAMDLLRRHDVDVIVSDQRMPGMTGVDVLRAAREVRPRAMRVLLTGYSDLNDIIGSINEGEIFRFVNKPWSNDALQATVAQAAETARGMNADEAARLNAREDAAVGPRANGVLVLDTDTPNVDELKRVLSADFSVYHARNLQQALDLLEKHPIGVLIVETMVDGEPVSALLSELKKHHPQIVAIVLTHRSDAQEAIELINAGQIFRLLIKPVRDGICKLSVRHGMTRHDTLVQSPTLVRRYTVEAPRAAANSEVSAGLLQRIRQLRTLFGAAPPR
ncbi:MAG: response regulator [Nevskiales bacterium]